VKQRKQRCRVCPPSSFSVKGASRQTPFFAALDLTLSYISSLLHPFPPAFRFLSSKPPNLWLMLAGIVLPSESAQYSAIIDDILAEADLATISAKQIRKGLKERLGEEKGAELGGKKVSTWIFLCYGGREGGGKVERG
jgi:hypothetical protein